MRLIANNQNGAAVAKVTEVTPENFILIVAGDTPEGRQCLREIMNARQAETAAIRKYLNLMEAKAQKAVASATIDKQ